MSTPTSIEQISKSLLIPTAESLPPKVEPEVVDEVQVETNAEEEETEEVTNDEEELVADGDEADDQDVDDEQADETADEPQILDLRDDDLIEVKIDGKVVQKTFGDALKALSGEGAIHARVQEASRDRDAARQEREEAQKAIQEAASLFVDTVKQFEDTIYVPFIPAPPEQLKTSNPQQYIRHLDAYNKDQARLAEMRKRMSGTMAEFQKARQQEVENTNQEEARLLTQRRPHLADREKGLPLMKEMIQLAQTDYGFTPEQINKTMDHRIYMMLEDALRYKKLTSKGKLETDTVTTDRKNAPRKLRAAAARTATAKTSRAREQKSLVDKARKSGKIDDVAKTLIQRK